MLKNLARAAACLSMMLTAGAALSGQDITNEDWVLPTGQAHRLNFTLAKRGSTTIRSRFSNTHKLLRRIRARYATK